MTSPHFALGTFSTAEKPHETFPGLVVDDQILDLRGPLGLETTTRDLLDDWEQSHERLIELAVAGAENTHDLAGLRPQPPVASRQVLCAGANYYQHVRQIVYSFLRQEGDERPEEEVRAEAEEQVQRRAATEPFMFVGLPSALCGADDDVILWGPGKLHDWELELAAVIGRGGRDIQERDAMDHIAGYTISNDISTRDVMNRPNFPMTDFLRSKCRPTFFPTGPYIVPREFVPRPASAAHHAVGQRRCHAG